MAIVGAVFGPLALAAIVLFATLWFYFPMLLAYVGTRDLRTAGITMSVTILGFFIWLLLNVIASARLAAVVDGRPHRKLFAAGAQEARLCAAMLRYLAIVLVGGMLVLGGVLTMLIRFPATQGHHIGLSLIALYCGLVVAFYVRCGQMLPTLVGRGHRRVIRDAWALTRGHFWRLAAVVLVTVVLPTLVVEALGESLVESILGFRPNDLVTMRIGAQALASNLAAVASITLSVSLSTGLWLTLGTLSGGLLYRRLAPQS